MTRDNKVFIAQLPDWPDTLKSVDAATIAEAAQKYADDERLENHDVILVSGPDDHQLIRRFEVRTQLIREVTEVSAS